tara:strand:- start:2197 stop:3006 length:810 start_codon:yes stop_codon:yes gene_type:complete
MIIGKNFFITEMPKTGTSFLRSYLEKYPGITLTKHHDFITDHNDIELIKKKYKISTIRSPYSWYYSMWKWSCLKQKESPLFSDLTSYRLKLKRLRISRETPMYIFDQIKKNINRIKQCFSDVNSKSNFKEFIKLLLYDDFKNYIGSNFSFTVDKQLGYMTWLFFGFNTNDNNRNIFYNRKIKFNEKIQTLDSKIFINKYFHTETLNQHLLNFLSKNNIEIKKFESVDMNKTAETKEYINYLDQDDADIIYDKEKYLFEKFNFNKDYKNL